jgi:hypothetical protein
MSRGGRCGTRSGVWLVVKRHRAELLERAHPLSEILKLRVFPHGPQNLTPDLNLRPRIREVPAFEPIERLGKQCVGELGELLGLVLVHVIHRS